MATFTEWDAPGAGRTSWDDVVDGPGETRWDLLPDVIGRGIRVIWQATVRGVSWLSIVRGVRW